MRRLPSDTSMPSMLAVKSPTLTLNFEVMK